ncbi:amidohydrolase family protein [candidate division WOR-3 bacterium]|nr:amidohydrolase family protein [candidate division WOR-3 bacterium]
MKNEKNIVIHAETLFDGEEKIKGVAIVIEGGLITDLSKSSAKADFSGVVTPSLIDAHSHIGMAREGEPADEEETNDILSQFLPLNDPLNSIYFDDRAFTDAVDFGVLYSCVIPGSGNLLGGKAAVIKNYSSNRKNALLKDYGFKMALGYNPRSTGQWKGERPNTRMGIYALLESYFDEVLRKQEKSRLNVEKEKSALVRSSSEKKISEKEMSEELSRIEKLYECEFSSSEKEIIKILNGEKTVKVHVHKEDDALYLVHLVQKYKIRATADHLGDVFHKEIFDELAENGIPIVYGPLNSFSYKVELKHSYYQNVKLLMQSKAFYGLMTDHPVIMTNSLRDSLKYFLIYGMPEEKAIGIITKNNAKILGIDNDFGTVKPGKVASLVVWDDNPLSLSAFPEAVFAEGKIIRRRHK